MAHGAEPFVDSYLPYLLRKADQTLSAPFYAVLNQNGISRSEWRVLAVLSEHDALSVIDLAREALCPQPTVTHAVRRLEKRKLVARALGTEDKRQRFISMSPAGAKLTAALIAEARGLAADALTDVGDLSALIKQLETLTARVETNLRQPAADTTRAG